MIGASNSMLNMVKSFTKMYGVQISWQEPVLEKNSRGKEVLSNGDETVTATVLFLKERFSAMKTILASSIGLSHDHSKYLITLPEVNITKDLIITDHHGIKWKLGPVDWIDIAGSPVAKQAALLEVN